MDKIFVVGDVHGKLSMLNTLLSRWNQDSEKLVFVGDYIDRGNNSYEVVHLVKELHEKYGAVALGGNHELMFLNWLDFPEDIWFKRWVENESIINYYPESWDSSSIIYFVNGGDKTIDSFYDKPCAYKYFPSKHARYIKDNFAEEIEFLRSLPDYFEWKDYVCVHAGVDLGLIDWKNTASGDFRWIREPFHYTRNETGKKFIFGHTPTRGLHKNTISNEVWFSKCKTKIGIDGGAVFGGLLHGLVIEDDVVSIYSVDKDLNVTIKP